MDIRNSIQKQNEWSLLLASRIALSQARQVNFVFSPRTLQLVLSMVVAGSRGPTPDQLLSFLRAQTREEVNSFSAHIVSLIQNDGSRLGGPALSWASGVWVDESWQDIFPWDGAEVKIVDFRKKAAEVIKEVNNWTKSKTNGLIKELLPPYSVDDLTRLILVDTLYFKGTWEDEFDACATKEKFYPLSGGPVQVPFMTSKKKQFVAAFPGLKVLMLPCGRGKDKKKFSMYLFLPDKGNDLHNLGAKVGSDMDFIDKHLPTTKVSVGQFMIPKFKISYDFEDSQFLKQMGLLLPFSLEAELTEMIDSPMGNGLPVFKKSFIEVNEKGTEAAAATAVVVSSATAAVRSSIPKVELTFGCDMVMPKPPTDFVADHPFLFLILEKGKDAPLFVGPVFNPSFIAA